MSCLLSFTLCLISFRQAPSPNLELTNFLLGHLSVSALIPNSGVKGVCSLTWVFLCIPGPKPRSSCLNTKWSYPLSIFPSLREESPYSGSEGSR